MQNPAQPRKPSPLPRRLHDHLNAYSLVAGAAGVAALAAASPAEAKIIYTPVNINIAPHHSVRIDLNHDGVPDFEIKNNVFRTTDVYGNTLLAKPLVTNNAVAGFKGVVFTYYASAFKSGATIGPSQQFSGKILAASGMEYGYIGQWRNVTNRYLGLKFYIGGQEHFGWARLTVSSGTGTITAKLTGFAYETSVGKPIVAGATKSVDTLAELDLERDSTLRQPKAPTNRAQQLVRLRPWACSPRAPTGFPSGGAKTTQISYGMKLSSSGSNQSTPRKSFRVRSSVPI